MIETDYLIVGAGFSGLVMAERLATQLGKRCLVVEKRNHIGGNAQDEVDSAGVLVHKYGPHYFRTNSDKIRDYLSQFTDWHPCDYRVVSFAQGRLWDFPINLKTYEQLIGHAATEDEFEHYLQSVREPMESPRNSEEVVLSRAGRTFYELFYENYTLKHWDRHPRELAASVCGRIPIRTNRDNRYFDDAFQALPKHGYHRLFQRIAAASDLIDIRLQTPYREILPHVRYSHLVFTGPIDEFYDFCYGPLPYRSLRFENESFGPDELAARTQTGEGRDGQFWQQYMQVNYPGPEPFTRICEVKHATGQICENTTIVREYSDDYAPGKEAFYPIPAPDSSAIYRKYADRAAQESNISFIGRLATYKYYNMDQVVGMALTEFEKLRR